MFIFLRLSCVLLCLASLHLIRKMDKDSNNKRTLFISLFLCVSIAHYSTNLFFSLMNIGQESSYIYYALPWEVCYTPFMYFAFLSVLKGKPSKQDYLWQLSLPTLAWVAYFILIANPNLPQNILSGYYIAFYVVVLIQWTYHSLSILTNKDRPKLNTQNRQPWGGFLLPWFILLATLFFGVSFILNYKEERIVKWETDNTATGFFVFFAYLFVFFRTYQRYSYSFQENSLHISSTNTSTQQIVSLNNTTLTNNSYLKKHLETYLTSEAVTNPNLNTKQMAQDLQISQKTLNEEIKHVFQTSVSKLLVQKRIEYAARYLNELDTEPTYDNLYKQFGFGSRAAFYRNFQQQMGCTPSEYYQYKQLCSN